MMCISPIVTPQSINKGNTDMPIKTLDQRIQEVQSALAQGFTTKSGKKDTMYSLSCVFDEVKDVLKDAIWDVERSTGERIEDSFDIICKQLHHFKVEHIEFFAQYNSHNQKAISDLYKVLDLRDQIKSAEIGVKEKSATQLMLEEEIKMVKAVKDNGFRTNNHIWTQFWDCENEFGTQWERCDWYLDGRRTAFSKCMAVVGKDFRFWTAKGCPNMKGWDFSKIAEFYNS